ncbi:unnamed protein product [Paramecium primaurelia]|uniref:Uncharacterized protein n=1 Tax=Paramecium primaurelia TaxID=5886 RepID=A0A8S1JSE7_PARPR|nr:unnamed protein product [Paramecium primaurelia]
MIYSQQSKIYKILFIFKILQQINNVLNSKIQKQPNSIENNKLFFNIQKYLSSSTISIIHFKIRMIIFIISKLLKNFTLNLKKSHSNNSIIQEINNQNNLMLNYHQRLQNYGKNLIIWINFNQQIRNFCLVVKPVMSQIYKIPSRQDIK